MVLEGLVEVVEVEGDLQLMVVDSLTADLFLNELVFRLSKRQLESLFNQSFVFQEMAFIAEQEAENSNYGVDKEEF
jgi:hypothetical protein